MVRLYQEVGGERGGVLSSSIQRFIQLQATFSWVLDNFVFLPSAQALVWGYALLWCNEDQFLLSYLQSRLTFTTNKQTNELQPNIYNYSKCTPRAENLVPQAGLEYDMTGLITRSEKSRNTQDKTKTRTSHMKLVLWLASWLVSCLVWLFSCLVQFISC